MTVTTVAELDALEEGTILQGDLRMFPYSICTKDSTLGWDDRVWWVIAVDIPYSAAEIADLGPLEVLYRPAEQARRNTGSES